MASRPARAQWNADAARMPSSSTPRSPTSPRRSCICRPPMTCVFDAVRACARHCGSPLRAAAVAASNDGDGLVCADRAPAWPRIDEDCALLLPSQLRATIVAARKLARMRRESYARPRSPSRRWPRGFVLRFASHSRRGVAMTTKINKMMMLRELAAEERERGFAKRRLII